MPGEYDFPPYLPSEYDRQPIGGAPLSPMPNMLSPPGNMPMDQQTLLIEQIKRMAMSQDPRERAAAKRVIDEFGRSPFMMGLDRATRLPFNMVPPGPGGQPQGLSTYMQTQGQTGANSPQNIDFANRLTRGVRPGEVEGAEVAGTAFNMLPYFLAMRRGRSPAGMPPAGPKPPGPPGPLIPESWLTEQPGSSPSPPDAPPLAPAGPREMQGPPQFPRMIERWRRGEPDPWGPQPTDRPTIGEGRYGDFLDTGQPTLRWRFQKRGPDGRFQKGMQEFEDAQPGGYDPFSLRQPLPPRSRRFRSTDED